MKLITYKPLIMWYICFETFIGTYTTFTLSSYYIYDVIIMVTLTTRTTKTILHTRGLGEVATQSAALNLTYDSDILLLSLFLKTIMHIIYAAKRICSSNNTIELFHDHIFTINLFYCMIKIICTTLQS